MFDNKTFQLLVSYFKISDMEILEIKLLILDFETFDYCLYFNCRNVNKKDLCILCYSMFYFINKAENNDFSNCVDIYNKLIKQKHLHIGKHWRRLILEIIKHGRSKFTNRGSTYRIIGDII